ncbi:hypothetical protein DB30_02545 [Enhygromyxa salina]|uniref:Uncharacterized protein n=1 Tax=Enhygromyxa salina TaxID=215803 RepID=A0A0C2CV69_9BACT|nr:hypothetical protein [Enhygromyxa salina]KIG11767.1 hypothetical protein DB30_02545 [Enhygromyxa salina]
MRNPDSPLEQIGERLYTARAKYMLDNDVGLTKTYNALKDPDIHDPAVALLRELDRTVLAAYGWSHIQVPPYTDPQTPDEKAIRQAFEDSVIDELFKLNAERAAQERELADEAPAQPETARKPKVNRARTKKPSRCGNELDSTHSPHRVP